MQAIKFNSEALLDSVTKEEAEAFANIIISTCYALKTALDSTPKTTAQGGVILDDLLPFDKSM